MPIPNNPPGVVGPDLGGLTGGSLAPSFNPVNAPGIFSPGDPGTAIAVPDVAPTIGHPRTFVAAVRKVLREDAELRARVVGGWWHRKIPPRVKEPVGVYLVPTDERTHSGGPNYIHTGTLQLTVYGPRNEETRLIAEGAVRVLTDNPLTFTNGRVYYLRMESPVSSDTPEPGYGGSDIFRSMRVFSFLYQGRYPA